MTLIAGLSIGGFPFLLGDLLLSRRKGEGAAPEVDLPTRHRAEEFVSGREVVGCEQKVVLLGPNLAVAWSGTEFAASVVIGRLRALNDSSVEGIKAFLGTVDYLNPSWELSLIVMSLPHSRDHGPVQFLSWDWPKGDFPLPLEVDAGAAPFTFHHVYGSGAEDFISS